MILKLENILTTEERLDLLKKSEHYVFEWGDRPGFQSHNDMHQKIPVYSAIHESSWQVHDSAHARLVEV